MSAGPGFTTPSRPSLRSLVRAPLQRQTYRNLAYLALAFPLGIAYFVFLSVGLSLGIALLITVVGLPILLFVLAAATGIASAERKLTTYLLGVEIDPPEARWRDDDLSILDRAKALVADVGAWKAVVYLASKLVLGILSFTLIMTMLTTSVSLLFVPFVYDQPHVKVGLIFEDPTTIHPALSFGWGDLFVGFQGTIPLTSWEISTLPGALAVAVFGVVLIVVALNLLNGLAWLSGKYARFMLGERSDSLLPI